MNCPNCDKKPTGLFYIYRGKDFDFKTRMRGYFKCQHCDSMLRQQKTALGMPSFNILYYFHATIFVGMVGVGSFYLFDMFEEQDVSMWINVGAFVLILGLALSGINVLANRYRNIEEVDEVEVKEEPKKLTNTGIAVFGVYLFAAVGLFLAINKYVDMRELGFAIYLVVQFVYLIAVILGVFYLFKKFEKREEEHIEV